MIDLQPLFANVNGTNFIGLDTCTVPVLKGGKKNRFQDKIKKVMTGASVMVFSNSKTNGYERTIQRRLVQEGKDPATFTVGPRVWGQRLPECPIVVHNNKQYLEVIFLKPGKVSYLFEDQSIDKAEIEGLEDKEESEQGGLENKVIIRTFAAENLTRIAIDGVEIVR